MSPVILASSSPRRRQLLELAEVSFQVQVAHTAEEYPEGLLPAGVAQHIAVAKACAVQQLPHGDYHEHTIIAADTIVVLDGEIIGKPEDREDAIAILRKLSGRTHQVITGVCMLHGEEKIVFSETTFVTFHPLQDHQIVHYVDHYRPFDKAGAYAIQEWIGCIGIQKIEGDFYNVMGLPISRVVATLHQNAW